MFSCFWENNLYKLDLKMSDRISKLSNKTQNDKKINNSFSELTNAW